MPPEAYAGVPIRLFDMRVRSAFYEVIRDDLSGDNNRGTSKGYYGYKKSLPRKIELDWKLRHGPRPDLPARGHPLHLRREQHPVRPAKACPDGGAVRGRGGARPR